MPKKRRRKLSPEMEKEISLIKKEVELILAKINDIDEEDLQVEYKKGFDGAKAAFIYLTTEYQENGFTDQAIQWRDVYRLQLKKFESEFEI